MRSLSTLGCRRRYPPCRFRPTCSSCDRPLTPGRPRNSRVASLVAERLGPRPVVVRSAAEHHPRSKRMKTTKALLAGAAVAACALLWAACTHGAQLADGGTAIDPDDIAGVVPGRAAPRRGVGDRRDQRPPDEARQDRGDRRPGALAAPRPSAGALRRVGARIRAGRTRPGSGPARVGGGSDPPRTVHQRIRVHRGPGGQNAEAPSDSDRDRASVRRAHADITTCSTNAGISAIFR